MLEYIKTSIVGKLFAACAVVLASSLVLVAYCSAFVPQISALQKQSEALSMAMRNHVEADMMHDALRTSVLSAVHAGSEGGNGREIIKEAEGYTAWLDRAAERNSKLGLSAELHTGLGQAGTDLNAFSAEANRLIKLALRDSGAAEAQLDTFEAQFKALEASNLALSNRLDAELAAVGKQMQAELDWLFVLEWLAGLSAVVMVGVFALYLRQRIILPVVRISRALEAGSNDELAAEGRRGDEIGRLAANVLAFREATLAAQRAEQARIETEETARREVAEAEESVQRASREAAETERKRALVATGEALEARISGIARQVSETTTRLKQVADKLASSAQGSRLETAAAAAAAKQTLDGVVTIAEAADELVVSINEVSSRIGEVAGSGDKVRTLTNKAESHMSELGDAADRITSITELIGTIAARTNLLALNASIEAARAGESGRGFAVVAGEVKELAGQTASAVSEIDKLISAIVQVTRNTGSSIADVADAIETLAGATSSIATAAQQQGLATHEITRTIHQSSSGTEAMRENLAAMDSQARTTEENATIVLDAANELEGKAAELGREIGAFIAQAKAA